MLSNKLLSASTVFRFIEAGPIRCSNVFEETVGVFKFDLAYAPLPIKIDSISDHYVIELLLQGVWLVLRFNITHCSLVHTMNVFLMFY